MLAVLYWALTGSGTRLAPGVKLAQRSRARASRDGLRPDAAALRTRS